jgi:hypothetical protein
MNYWLIGAALVFGVEVLVLESELLVCAGAFVDSSGVFVGALLVD